MSINGVIYIFIVACLLFLLFCCVNCIVTKGPLHKYSYLDQKLVTPRFSANFIFGHPLHKG